MVVPTTPWLRSHIHYEHDGVPWREIRREAGKAMPVGFTQERRWMAWKTQNSRLFFVRRQPCDSVDASDAGAKRSSNTPWFSRWFPSWLSG